MALAGSRVGLGGAAFQRDYPDWEQVYDMPMIMQEIYDANVDRWVPGT